MGSRDVFNQLEPGKRVCDFTCEDDVAEILEGNDLVALESLRQFAKIAPEQMRVFHALAQLRKSLHEGIRVELEARISERPRATSEELSMGAYVEQIEPQVRETVINMRRKGYNTYESGFHGVGSEQIISIQGEDFEGIKFSDKLTDACKNKGITIVVSSSSIILELGNFLSVAEIGDVWKAIEKELPDLGKAATDSDIGAAKSFREQQLSG